MTSSTAIRAVNALTARWATALPAGIHEQLSGEVDLLGQPALFGLATAADTSRGHFPGISASPPLAVQCAAQAMTATFGARGFRSAAVTSLVACGGAMPRYPYRVRRIDARFDHPFGFLVVHRTSRLVLGAGWVAEPELLPSYESDEDEWL
ncbi:serine protease inhibitor [Kitasatospora sp. MAP12-15]|uniref:hypothetical protein n=1 Tax=unclassified Kitasatospora TaxID=2633591 RepID=UPI00247C902C|nr:serine protease inhibitor [Kitasatospora sp. MAP12-44]